MGEARVNLIDTCEGCGAPDGILSKHGDHFCPRCAGNVDLRDSAEQHLITYLTAALGPWKDHWEARGLTSMAELLETSAQEIFNALKQEAGST